MSAVQPAGGRIVARRRVGRLAVVGATGAVGQTMLKVLLERSFPVDEIVALASERSAGQVLEHGRDRLPVQGLTGADLKGVDIALMAAGGSVSREWAPQLAAAGAIVVDNSSFWRMEPTVPLVVAELNPEDLDRHSGIVANPNCSTMQMVMALKPIHDAAGLERVVVSTYQSVSGTGNAAVEELMEQSRAVLRGDPVEATVYPRQIAFNVLPQVETFKGGDPYTTEERKMRDETRKILHDPEIPVSATCVRVPVVVGHSQSVNVETQRPLPADECRDLLRAAPGVTVMDEPAAGRYPLAIDAAGRDDVFVGRIRADDSAERCLNLWVVSDNLRKGAATNAVQLAELLVERGLVEAR